MSSTDDSALSYEQAREELIEVVRRLEQGGAPLGESIELWQRGERLAAICQEKLAGAQKLLDETIGSEES